MDGAQIIVVDDHGIFRSGLRMILQNYLQESEIFEAESVDVALTLPVRYPNLVLLDLDLEGADSLERFHLISQKWPRCPVVVITANADEARRQQAISAGVVGYVRKSDGPTVLMTEVERVLSRAPNKIKVPATARGLSKRQMEVLGYLRQGLPNKLIAERMALSEYTVRGHVQSILRSLGVNSRSAAIFEALNTGILK
jgi:DNA-binding NarL/FixJ family response regulator